MYNYMITNLQWAGSLEAINFVIGIALSLALSLYE